jgi:hypothetical protein
MYDKWSDFRYNSMNLKVESDAEDYNDIPVGYIPLTVPFNDYSLTGFIPMVEWAYDPNYDTYEAKVKDPYFKFIIKNDIASIVLAKYSKYVKIFEPELAEITNANYKSLNISYKDKEKTYEILEFIQLTRTMSAPG